MSKAKTTKTNKDEALDLLRGLAKGQAALDKRLTAMEDDATEPNDDDDDEDIIDDDDDESEAPKATKKGKKGKGKAKKSNHLTWCVFPDGNICLKVVWDNSEGNRQDLMKSADNWATLLKLAPKIMDALADEPEDEDDDRVVAVKDTYKRRR